MLTNIYMRDDFDNYDDYILRNSYKNEAIRKEEGESTLDRKKVEYRDAPKQTKKFKTCCHEKLYRR